MALAEPIRLRGGVAVVLSWSGATPLEGSFFATTPGQSRHVLEEPETALEAGRQAARGWANTGSGFQRFSRVAVAK